jgi:C1A family cysteine protease
MIYQVAVALTLVALASAKLYSDDAVVQKYAWEQFKVTHVKSYDTMEEEQRHFTIFLENLRVADLRNERERKAGGNAVHGITKFSDLSQAEFESQFLTADLSMKSKDTQVDKTVRAAATATVVDWSGIYTTPVKDQGYCGSCWAFSATEQIESDTMRTLATTYILSPEQITQCTTTCYGCGGGWTERAFSYAEKNAIVQNSDYPYTSYQGITGVCNANTAFGVVKVNNYVTISGESNMAAYVESTGPLSVCLDANSWNSYTGGIMSVCGQSVDHCVQAVGVYATTGGYWKVRNSWGTSWGENGYIRLAYGQNTCDITNDPIYTSVTKA